MGFTKIFKVATVVCALLISSLSFAQAVNVNKKGLAIKGYDPVAYFTENQAVKGNKDITATHEGATYRFSSEENKELFLADANRYLPQYGGFCAFGVSVDKKYKINPKAFHIVDGKLYLNLNKKVQKRWLTDVPGKIAAADGYWPGIKDLSVKAANADRD